MIWNKLVDRCLLFTDAPGCLLKALLKEAEQELSNKLELYDSLYTIEVPTTLYGLGPFSSKAGTVADHNYHKLPFDYMRDISVTHEGLKLRKMSEDEVYRSSSGEVSGGSPTAYGISGDFIVFNTTPSAGDKFILLYKCIIDDATINKVLTILHYKAIVSTANDNIYLDTLLGSLLNAKKIIIEGIFYEIGSGETSLISLPPGLPDRYLGNIYEKGGTIAATTIPKYFKGSRYTLSPDVTGVTGNSANQTEGVVSLTGAQCIVQAYRDIAPVIPERFHIDLCSYAIALANAKSAPEIHDKHWAAWLMNMDNLINESQDRDIIFSIREEI